MIYTYEFEATREIDAAFMIIARMIPTIPLPRRRGSTKETMASMLRDPYKVSL